ncbi:hypothetical protein JSY36_05205 [Bacillus sp. H-16]|nr:hypothetical protein [Alteribacter salitolerans]MBM7095151.1 hypothetical protein [Alteribacter salitolerans]
MITNNRLNPARAAGFFFCDKRQCGLMKGMIEDDCAGMQADSSGHGHFM